MNKFIVLFSLLVILAVSDLTPEQAGEKFLKSLLKHIQYKDSDIFTEEFHVQEGTSNYSRDSSVNHVLQLIGDSWNPHICSFTDDGLLKIKFFKNNKHTAYFLAKPNRNIEGGYKVDKMVYV